MTGFAARCRCGGERALPNEAMRERFLSTVPENAGLVALARELGVE